MSLENVIQTLMEKRASHDVFIEKVAARVLEKIAISIVGSGPAQQPGFFSNLMSGLGNFFRPSSAMAAGSAPVQQAAGGFASKDYLARQSQAKMDALGYRSGRIGTPRSAASKQTQRSASNDFSDIGDILSGSAPKGVPSRQPAATPASARSPQPVKPTIVPLPGDLAGATQGRGRTQFSVDSAPKPFPQTESAQGTVKLPNISARKPGAVAGGGDSHLFRAPGGAAVAPQQSKGSLMVGGKRLSELAKSAPVNPAKSQGVSVVTPGASEQKKSYAPQPLSAIARPASSAAENQAYVQNTGKAFRELSGRAIAAAAAKRKEQAAASAPKPPVMPQYTPKGFAAAMSRN